jgi:hypothetical protein
MACKNLAPCVIWIGIGIVYGMAVFTSAIATPIPAVIDRRLVFGTNKEEI